MDTAKLRLPAWTENDGQRLVLDPEQVPADMNEAADEIERLRTALERVLLDIDFMIERGTLTDIRNDMIYVEAHKLLNQQNGRKE